MEERKLTCIGCPFGCSLTVTLEGKEPVSVTGNRCKKGSIYGKKEVTDTTRIVTSTVRLIGGTQHMLPVKTASDIPKEKMFDCIRAIKSVKKKAPVRIGDVVLKNVADTGVDVIAAQTVEAQSSSIT